LLSCENGYSLLDFFGHCCHCHFVLAFLSCIGIYIAMYFF
jgi:hypothetical protein